MTFHSVFDQIAAPCIQSFMHLSQKYIKFPTTCDCCLYKTPTLLVVSS